MNRLSCCILMLLLILVGSASATDGRFHPNHLFVKMKAGQSLVKSPLIQSKRKIIKNLYLVKTQDLGALEAALAGNMAIEYVQKDFYAGKQKLPKLEPLDVFSSTFKSMDMIDGFNDPQVPQLWAFSAKSGMNVLGAYNALPTHSP